MGSRTDNTLAVVWTVVVRLLVIAALVFIAWKVRSVLITVVLAVMLTYLLLPATEYLSTRRPIRRKSKRATRLIASLLVFAVFFSVVGVAVHFLFSNLMDEATRFEEFMFSQKQPAWARINEVFKTIADKKSELESHLPREWKDFLKEQGRKMGSAGLGFAGTIFTKTLGWLANIVELVMIPVLAFYFLLDYRSLKREVLGLVPRWRVRDVLRIMRETGRILQNYVIGQLVLCLIAGVVTGLVLHLAGLRNYVLILAVFAGVTRAIPIIGPAVSGIPICLVGWSQGGAAMAAWLLVFVVIMHFAESKFIMPILIGDRMKLHPAVILISLLMGAQLFGLLGMFIAAPIAAVVRDLLNEYVVKTRRDKQMEHAQAPEMSPST